MLWKRLAILLVALCFATPGSAQLRKYGVATKVYFALVELAGLNFTTAATCATGDVKVSKDAGNFANTTACFVSEGEGIYSLALSAVELQAAAVVITIKDQTNPKVWLDDRVEIATYGDVLAQHAMDLDSEAFLYSQRTIYTGTIEDEDFGSTITQFQADLVDPYGAPADLSSLVVPNAANRLNSRIIIFISGDLAGSVTTISDFEQITGRGQFTVSGLTEAPTDGDRFVIF